MDKLNIIKQKENPLFNRKEIELSVEAEATPSNSEIEKFISEKFSAPVENIKIKKILGRFGSKIFKIIVNIYNSKQDKEKIELKKSRKTKGEKK